MATEDDIESHLIRMDLAHELVAPGTWLVAPEAARQARIAVKMADPIVLFTMAMFELPAGTPDPDGLFRKLLELNSELLHSSYALDDNRIVLSGAQQLENLDFNEFQAVLDDIGMALDKHYELLAPWASDAAAHTAATTQETT